VARAEAGLGLITRLELPSGGKIGVYQPFTLGPRARAAGKAGKAGKAGRRQAGKGGQGGQGGQRRARRAGEEST